MHLFYESVHLIGCIFYKIEEHEFWFYTYFWNEVTSELMTALSHWDQSRFKVENVMLIRLHANSRRHIIHIVCWQKSIKKTKITRIILHIAFLCLKYEWEMPQCVVKHQTYRLKKKIINPYVQAKIVPHLILCQVSCKSKVKFRRHLRFFNDEIVQIRRSRE